MNRTAEKIREEAVRGLEGARDIVFLQELETRFLGRRGKLTEFLRTLGDLPAEERRAAGEEANAVKRELETLFAQKRSELQATASGALAEQEWIDVTAPGAPLPEGHLHITTRAIREITSVFERLGYNRVRYPEVEWDWYAFESLNMPKDHPARDEWETFFLQDRERKGIRSSKQFGRMVLTPHTSNGQVREMERGELPIRMVNISRTYRRQSDVTHVPMFHQFEGLFIDKDVSVTHLKGTLDSFARSFFGEGRRTRLRPFHFRFTEPSFEIDISCGVCGGTGMVSGARCRVCKQGWHELGGAGMVHPNVLKAGGIDPKRYRGFAFGWGVERAWMMKAGTHLDDLRVLYRNDVRFLEQF